jgi:hypothetical protein
MDSPDAAHTRPDGVDDATVEALGKVSEAFEVIEQARGMLYGFHRMIGMATSPRARRCSSCARPATPSSPTGSTRS